MSFYLKGINKVKSTVFSNEGQLQTVIAIRNYLNDHFDEQLCLDLLSSTHHISKFHLLRLFKKYYGQTPLQYLTDRRLEQAKLLLEKGKPVSEVCFEVGFESPSSFSTLFKSRFGQNPTIFLQKRQFSQSREEKMSGILWSQK